MEKSRTHKILNNSWTITIGGTVIGGIILSFIIDTSKNKPLLTTFEISYNWLCETIINILNYTVPVYAILLSTIGFILILLGIIYIENKSTKNKLPTFASYTTDTLIRLRWSWRIHIDYSSNKFNIRNLAVHCPKSGCDTKMSITRSGGFSLYECPRCRFQIDSTQQNFEEEHRINALIVDNIEKMIDN